MTYNTAKSKHNAVLTGEAHTDVLSMCFLHQIKPSGKEKKAKDVGSPPSGHQEVSSPPSTGDGERKKLVTQDTLDSPSLSQTPSVSSEDPLSPVVRRKYFDYLTITFFIAGCQSCSAD